VTNKKSFMSVAYWVETLRERTPSEDVQIMLVGNKIDRAQYREVSVGEGEELARQFGISYCEVSAGDPSLLAALFRSICQSKRIMDSEI
jgi:GTPase SAR1 family protein